MAFEGCDRGLWHWQEVEASVGQGAVEGGALTNEHGMSCVFYYYGTSLHSVTFEGLGDNQN